MSLLEDKFKEQATDVRFEVWIQYRDNVVCKATECLRLDQAKVQASKLIKKQYVTKVFIRKVVSDLSIVYEERSDDYEHNII